MATATPTFPDLSLMSPQDKHEYLLNQVLESTSKILTVLTPIAEKYVRMHSRDWESGPRRRNNGFGNMSRKKRLGLPAKPKPVVETPVVDNTDETMDETPVNATMDETPVDENIDETPVNNNSQDGGSRKNNKKSKGKKSRRSRR